MSKYIDPRSKLLQHVDRIAALKAGQYCPPVNVEIDLSNRCSLGCEWCHFGYTHTRGPLAGTREKPNEAMPGGDLMDFYLAQNIINDLTAAQVRSITWTGGGEPTLHPRFDDVIRYAARFPIDQGLYTHGGHIDAERAALLKAALKWVYVSLDCPDRETYKREKGVDRFEFACQGVRNLAAAAGAATVGVGFLIHAGNYQHAYRMHDLAMSLGADYAQFRPAVFYDILDPDHAMSSTAWIDDALQALSGLGKQPGVIVDTDRFTMYRDWHGHGYQTCYWAGLQTCITPDGSVWTCVNKREHAAAWLGNLTQDNFYAIWSEHGGAKQVDETCRVLCRGHVPNVALSEMLQPVPHGNFI
jgi:GTP 3',8-cyclase